MFRREFVKLDKAVFGPEKSSSVQFTLGLQFGVCDLLFGMHTFVDGLDSNTSYFQLPHRISTPLFTTLYNSSLLQPPSLLSHSLTHRLITLNSHKCTSLIDCGSLSFIHFLPAFSAGKSQPWPPLSINVCGCR